LDGLDRSDWPHAAALITDRAPGAKVVKAFSQTGAENMRHADYPGGKPVNFIAGDDADARSTVAGLSRDVGFDSVELDGLEHAAQLEEMAWLWIRLAMAEERNPNIAFALLRR
jgi:predicted dinucleotide-binding enzyme